jgi:predicted RNA-binding protein with PUA-like domain
MQNVTDAQVRDGAMGMRQFAINNSYSWYNDNCGAAVIAGLSSAGDTKHIDYENIMIDKTMYDPYFWVKVTDGVANFFH